MTDLRLLHQSDWWDQAGGWCPTRDSGKAGNLFAVGEVREIFLGKLPAVLGYTTLVVRVSGTRVNLLPAAVSRTVVG